jgi:hypothetical protein
MRPHLLGGDQVAVVAPRARPRAGDLLVYRQQDYLVVHRYLGRARAADGNRCLRTRGDGRNELDPPVLPDAVAARVVAVARDGAWRSLEGTGAMVYARLVAWHDLAWAAAGVGARRIGFGGVAARLDRWFLTIGAAVLFPVIHARIAAPAALGPDATV